MISYIKDRVFDTVNVKQFEQVNKPQKVTTFDIDLLTPPKDQYILRCCIKAFGSDLQIPKELLWIKPLLKEALSNQQKLGVDHPFIYVTVRNGKVKSKTDDQWHLDGFSTRIEHTPEQNYIYTNNYCTEYIEQGFTVPDDLDPLEHNLNTFLEPQLNASVKKCEDNTLYCIDPYILHRRPANIPKDFKRVFVRISFVPIQINDINNTINPLLPLTNTKDGVKFRDKLKNYWNK